MRGEPWALGVGEYLVRRACRRLPAGVRDQRYQEWAAELPVILHDPEVRPAARRVARMLGFAADTLRGTTLARRSYRYRGAHQGRADWNVLWLLVFPPMLAYLGYSVYQMIFGPSAGWYAALWGFFLPNLVYYLARRRPRRTAGLWCSAGGLALSSGLFAGAWASSHGWHHPPAFTLIGYCGTAICIACFGVAVTLRVKPAYTRPSASARTPAQRADTGRPGSDPTDPGRA